MLSLLLALTAPALAASLPESPSQITPRSSVIPQAPFHAVLSGKIPRPNAIKSRYSNVIRNKPFLQSGLGSRTSSRENEKGFRKRQQATLAGTQGDVQYIVNVTIGTPPQSLSAIVDTGSSDPWLISSTFTCYTENSRGQIVKAPSQATCGFGGSYTSSKSSSFSSISSENLNISYADGEYLNGPVGKETITIGGLTVTSQEFGLPNQAFWFGDGINAGLIGFSYPGITSVYSGTNPNNDVFGNSIKYNPFFFNAVAEGTVSQPVFSVALNRGTLSSEENDSYDNNLGYLAFGGLPPVTTTSTTVTFANVKSDFFSNTPQYEWYIVQNPTYTFTGSKSASGGTTILDTGTTLNYIPDSIAELYASKFSPAAQYSDYLEAYYTSCTATAPAMTVTISGVKFTIDPRDQLLPTEDQNGNIVCMLGTQPGGSATADNVLILGDVFLHNVVLSVNINTNQITLTQRAAY